LKLARLGTIRLGDATVPQAESGYAF
jgi:hypothetical protein